MEFGHWLCVFCFWSTKQQEGGGGFSVAVVITHPLLETKKLKLQHKLIDFFLYFTMRFFLFLSAHVIQIRVNANPATKPYFMRTVWWGRFFLRAPSRCLFFNAFMEILFTDVFVKRTLGVFSFSVANKSYLSCSLSTQGYFKRPVSLYFWNLWSCWRSILWLSYPNLFMNQSPSLTFQEFFLGRFVWKIFSVGTAFFTFFFFHNLRFSPADHNFFQKFRIWG